MNKEDNLLRVKEKLLFIPTIKVLQEYKESNSFGVTFDYMGTTYTSYIDAESESGELLKHSSEDISTIENVGTIKLDALISFFSSLPSISDITK